MVFICGVCSAGEKPEIKDKQDKINYSLGFQIGGDFKRQGMEINPDAVMKGIEDAFSDAEPRLNPETMRRMLLDVKKSILEERNREKRTAAQKYQKEAKDFFAENGKKDGVVTLPSGLQYKVIKEGNGRRPGPEDSVKVHYLGTLIDGTEFGSSYGREKPAIFRVNGIILGLTEALQLMREGANWQIYVPSDLAFGDRGALAYRTLIFDLELISVEAANSGDKLKVKPIKRTNKERNQE